MLRRFSFRQHPPPVVSIKLKKEEVVDAVVISDSGKVGSEYRIVRYWNSQK